MRILSVFILCCLFVRPCFAVSYILTPTIGMGGGYDDRVQIDEEDWYLKMTPSLKFLVEQENYKVQLSSDWSVYKYSELDEFDRIDQNYKAGISYQLSPRTTVGFDTSVRLDTDYEDEYEEGRISSVDATERQTYVFSPSYSYMLTEKDRIDFVYSFNMRENEADYNADYVAHSINLTWTRLYSEQIDLFIRAGVQRTEYEIARVAKDSRYYSGELLQDTLSLMGGFTYRPTERLALTLALGGGETFTRRDETTYQFGSSKIPLSWFGVQSDEQDSSSFTYLVNSELKWTGERFGMSGGYDRDIYSSAEGGDVVRDVFRVSGNYRLSELVTFETYISTIHLTGSGDSSDRDDWYYNITPALSYRFSENTFLRLSYSYSEEHNRDADPETRNKIFLDFTMSFPQSY